MNELFLYSNFYYNLGFNVTCILTDRKAYSNLDADILKSPYYEWQSFSHKRQSLEILHSYLWENAVGLGAVLGYNDLRAIDIDNCKDLNMIVDFLKILNLPTDYKWVIKSGSHNGFHILFYADEHKFQVARNKIKAFRPNERFKSSFKHIELRWLGHLVLPPSIHKSHMNYTFINGLPFGRPSRLNLIKLYTLLSEYCSGKSLNHNNGYIEEELKKSDDTSPVYIDEDENEESIDTSPVYIDKDENEESIDTSPVYIDEDEKEESIDTSPVYIDEDEKEESIDTNGFYIDEDEYCKPYYLFFDTETTGIPRNWKAPVSALDNWPRLVQLAWLLYDSKGNFICKKASIVKPNGFTIPKEASNVHGISTEYAIKHGSNLKEILVEFEKQCFKSKYLVAHNINFDSKVIGAEFLRILSINPIDKLEQNCTMESTVDYCKIEGQYGYKWPKLVELHIKLFGENFEGTHDALVDIEATAKCFWKLRELNRI